MIGQTLGHYRIVEKIGEGGMGEVYRAHDEQLARDVALKLLPAGTLSDEAARKQFRKEALALARLNHPNIETVFEFGSQEGVDFLAMELIPGIALRDKLTQGPLPEADVIRLGMQIAEGLAAAHEQGVIHRDLKPANLFVTPDERLKILDFGLAKLRHPDRDLDLTRSISAVTTTISGTVPYMSPEQLRALPTDPRSDIYSAGAVLFEMATGERPFPQMQSAELIGAILHQAPPAANSVNPGVSAELNRVILKAIQKDASRRQQSAAELRGELEMLNSNSRTFRAAPHVGAPAAKTSWVRGALFAIVVLAAMGFGARRWLFRSPAAAHALNTSDTIVLADFANSTGDGMFDDTLKEAMSVQLSQSPYLNVLSEHKVMQTLQLMGRPANQRLTPDVARDLCERTKSKAYVSGSIANLGSQYVVGLKAINCQSGDVLAQEQVQAARKEDVLQALDKAAAKLREEAGESISMIQKYDMPVEDATTPSLEALKAYSQGNAAQMQKGDAEAILFHTRATQLDPNFASAYASLGASQANIGEMAQAKINLQKAYDLRNHVSEREKFRISGLYHQLVDGDMEQANQAYLLWAQAYPRDSMPRGNLGVNYMYMGDYAKALVQTREAMELSPGDGLVASNLVENYSALNRFDEARAAYQNAQSRGQEYPYLHAYLYNLAFAQGDTAEMQRQVEWSVGKPGIEDVFLSSQADVEAFYGRMEKARQLSQQAVESAQRNGQKETAAMWEMNAALREAEFGDDKQARRGVEAAMGMASSRDLRILAALALARAGDVAHAELTTDNLEEREPRNTTLRGYWLPSIRAAAEINRKHAAKAIELLKTAAPFELGTPPPLQVGTMYPIYLRGQAYLLTQQGVSAAAEFQKIIDNPGIVMNFPLGSLARLGLARAYGLQNDAPKARAAYEDFLALWKDADDHNRILTQARSEYQKLK